MLRLKKYVTRTPSLDWISVEIDRKTASQATLDKLEACEALINLRDEYERGMDEVLLRKHAVPLYLHKCPVKDCKSTWVRPVRICSCPRQEHYVPNVCESSHLYWPYDGRLIAHVNDDDWDVVDNLKGSVLWNHDYREPNRNQQNQEIGVAWIVHVMNSDNYRFDYYGVGELERHQIWARDVFFSIPHTSLACELACKAEIL